MRLLLVLAPLVALGVYVLFRALSGRPLSRFALNVVVALFLLVYLFVTAALGVFWVARMDLPAFDWHYLFGYCVVLLATLHVAFQLRLLSSFFRRASPRALLSPGGHGFRPWVRFAAGVFGAAVLLVPLAWLAVAALREPEAARLTATPRGGRGAEPGASAASQVSSPRPRELWIERESGRISAFDYLHEQSSYSRTGMFRTVDLAPERPPDVKRYAGARVIRLPAPAARAGVSLAAALGERRLEGDRVVADGRERAPALAEVSDLLQYTYGVTSSGAESAGILLRAAASSGALYPVDVYVVSGAGDGLPRGLYYYDPTRHLLQSVAAPFEKLAAALPAPELLRVAPLAFVSAVTFDRTVSKYNVRSYRYVALDTGHVAANLLLAAAARGFDCRPLALFDDEIASGALALDANSEAVLLVVPCVRGSGAPELTSAAERPLGLPSLPERADQVELTRLSHRLTSVRLGDGVLPPRPVAHAVPSAVPGVGLPTPPALERDLFETIVNRRSFREFSDSPLELPELAAVLLAASRRPTLRSSPLVELHLLVHRVSGIEPGAYRYSVDRRLLVPLARGERAREIASAGLSQEVLGRAAAVLVWTLAPAAGSFDGTRDYRTAQLEAGFGGENVYLAASALGLGACGVGAFYDDEVDALLASGGDRPRSVYLQAIGRR